MIGIYQDEFVDYLKANLGYVKVTSKNIITKCPWCEYKKEKDHYHLHIGLEAPIFHCFHGSCEVGGILKKLIRKIEGHDISEQFIDKDTLINFKKKKILVDKEINKFDVKLPEVNSKVFPLKDLYLKKRLKFSNISPSSIKGLIYNTNDFLDLNQIPIDHSLFRIKDYLHSNFVGFLTENKSMVIFRNMDETSPFKFYKLVVQESNFVDYYKIMGNKIGSNHIVLAEGVFDIFTSKIFDFLNTDIKLYASVLSANYPAIIQSIVFNEQIFRPDLTILSDRGIPLEYYKKVKKFNNHIINKMVVYYNKTGKDFNSMSINPVKYLI
jgi:hypothetical protein